MEFTNPPGRHEREWRHPAEVAAEERAAFAQHGSSVGVIVAAIGGVGTLVAALAFVIVFATAAPYSPVTSLPGVSIPSRQPCTGVGAPSGCFAVTGSVALLPPATLIAASETTAAPPESSPRSSVAPAGAPSGEPSQTRPSTTVPTSSP